MAAKKAKNAAKKPAKKVAKAKKAVKKLAKKVARAGKAVKKAAKEAAKKVAKRVAKKPARNIAKKASPPKARKPDPKPKTLTVRRPVVTEKPRAEEALFVDRADRAKDDLAEELGESYVQSATSGEESALEMQNEETEEERGGPFVETTGQVEFADDVDESNPEDAEPAALPTTAAAEDDEE